jgi:hypothetical protein
MVHSYNPSTHNAEVGGSTVCCRVRPSVACLTAQLTNFWIQPFIKSGPFDLPKLELIAFMRFKMIKGLFSHPPSLFSSLYFPNHL